MKDVGLGNVLSNGSRVIGTMCIANENEEALYRVSNLSNVASSSVLFQGSILVTGAHYLLNRNTGKYVKVRDHPDARPTSDAPPVFTCLITDDHRICLGDREFWDWDDDAIPNNLR